jgi:hypothetical protein
MASREPGRDGPDETPGSVIEYLSYLLTAWALLIALALGVKYRLWPVVGIAGALIPADCWAAVRFLRRPPGGQP